MHFSFHMCYCMTCSPQLWFNYPSIIRHIIQIMKLWLTLSWVHSPFFPCWSLKSLTPLPLPLY
jgi:hypothetical protein